MKIYVLVHISYDYYRFQDNLYADTDKEKVKEFARKKNNKLDIYEYKDADSDEADFLWNAETEHWWIQELIADSVKYCSICGDAINQRNKSIIKKNSIYCHQCIAQFGEDELLQNGEKIEQKWHVHLFAVEDSMTYKRVYIKDCTQEIKE